MVSQDQRFLTNVEGLDELLHGGIVIPKQGNDHNQGLIILIKGAPGSGKTTLSCQLACSFLLENKEMRDELQKKGNYTLYYYTLDQTKEDIFKKIYKLIINNEIFKKYLEFGDPANLFNQLICLTEIWNCFKNYSQLLNLLEESDISGIEKNKCLTKEYKTSSDVYSEIKNIINKFVENKPFRKSLDDEIINNIRINILLVDNINKIDLMFRDFITLPNFTSKSEDEYKSNFSKLNLKELFITLGLLYIYKEILYHLECIDKNTNAPNILSLFEQKEKNNPKTGYQLILNHVLSSPKFDDRPLKSFICDLYVFSTQMHGKNEVTPKSTGLPLNSALSMLNAIPDTDDKSFITIIDGINSLTNEESSYFNFQTLVKSLRHKSRVSFIVYDPNINDSEFIDYMADMIIELRTEKSRDPIKYEKLTISIPKSRYQNAIRGSQHQYKIRKYGLVVFPYLHYYSTTERTGTGEISRPHLDVALERSKHSMNDNAYSSSRIDVVEQSSLIDKMLNGVFPGSVSVLIGPRHTSKTSLSMDFLKSKLNIKEVLGTESRLLVSIIDNASTIINERDCKRRTCKFYMTCYAEKNDIPEPTNPKCFNNIFLYHFQPLVITANELLFQIDRRIKESAEKNKPITRLAFFDLTQLEYRFPNIVNDPYFLSSFLDYLKSSRYTIEFLIDKNVQVTRKYNNQEIKYESNNKTNQSDLSQIFVEIVSGNDIIHFHALKQNENNKYLKISGTCINEEGYRINAESINLSFPYEDLNSSKSKKSNCYVINEINRIIDKINSKEINKDSLLMRIPFDSGFIKAEWTIEDKLVIIIEYRISSLFMVSGAAHLTKPISVLADNVIFLWRDKLVDNDKDKSFSEEWLNLYIDRTEGDIKVDSNRFYAFGISDKNKKNPLFDPEMSIDYSSAQPQDFFNAEKEIKKIVSLQGVTKNLYDYD